MKFNPEYGVFCLAAVVALYSLQPFLFFLILGIIFVWEDARWTAFDSENYDKKIANGPLKPWNRGN